ncbi:MAG: hypothetical protein PHW24_02595 [Candidatus Moranbacteria bacterium]|nr:hypothetical protein [Candidatus Moranbacteria bacterium]
MKKENCLKIVSLLLSYLQQNPVILLVYSAVYKKFIELLDKSNMGTVEAEIHLEMNSGDLEGQIMLQDWMEVANYLGSMSSICLRDFGHTALDMEGDDNCKSVIIYFQPDD